LQREVEREVVRKSKAATSAIGLGILFLLGTVIYERRKEWLTDPYRDVYR
jgi:hypothetical protein